jgi:hypothetical protein
LFVPEKKTNVVAQNSIENNLLKIGLKMGSNGAVNSLNKIVFETSNKQVKCWQKIKQLSLYYTGKQNTFSNTNKIASINYPDSIFEIAVPVLLNKDSNFFWLMADIEKYAAAGDTRARSARQRRRLAQAQEVHAAGVSARYCHRPLAAVRGQHRQAAHGVVHVARRGAKSGAHVRPRGQQHRRRRVAPLSRAQARAAAARRHLRLPAERHNRRIGSCFSDGLLGTYAGGCVTE